jgi:ADP-heptose:LPS heptosyltransferase
MAATGAASTSGYHASSSVDTSPRSVLFVRLSALGDVARSLPVLDAARRSWPGARLGWVVEERCAGLLRGHPQLDQLVVLPRRELARAWRSFDLARLARLVRDSARELVDEPHELAIDLQGNWRSGLVAAASRAPERVAYAPPFGREGGHRMATRLVEPPAGVVHEGERALALVAACGAGVAGARAHVPLDPARLAAVDAALLASDALEPIVLHPGVSGFGALKAWPAGRWSALAARLSEHAPVLVSFGPQEERLAQGVVAAAGAARVRLAPACLDVESLAALLSRARAVVAADTGPLHLAAALDRPVLGLYGAKDPRRFGPASASGRALALSAEAWCAPCERRRCPATTCMQALDEERVEAALLGLLAPAAPASR